ncbi:tyrosine-type recombinase/integrase [Aestuariicella hydrocarbonica]|uniref:Tyrosine-type recombinase/integrase n=1 Tax=Pseudomaricurvus hydrocarbonicus TaxID=1470433 RepID=A0A9E5MMA3_9GAMM|nr:site-specific integrase [Aestuariicella hydrocarbonica]NHO66728.1 tyrosine-type recombinase/integrase [Aestuariicella hydrocarbonica]
MLTDTKLRHLKPKEKLYKVKDRDGLYVAVTPKGTISFRYNYSINGRQETLTIGRYGNGGISLAEARDHLGEAKRKIAEGMSPAREKHRNKTRKNDISTFSEWAEAWLAKHIMAESTRKHRIIMYESKLKSSIGKLQLSEIMHEDFRALFNRIVNSGVPASALVTRDIVNLVYKWAIECGQNITNPVANLRPSSIVRLVPRDRVLVPKEIALMYRYLDRVNTSSQYRAALKLLLLTMVRKSELIQATWSEIDLKKARWIIPKERMKLRRDHVVYLSRQALELFETLYSWSMDSEYIFPSRNSSGKSMASSTLNILLKRVYDQAQIDGKSIEKFCPHDLRRTASTHLHEAGYNTDWIEKSLAHEQRGVRAVYNKAEYREQRTAMLQDWADMIDEWTIGRDQNSLPGR